MSIRSKLTIMFLSIGLIPLLLVTAITFQNYKDSLEANRLSQLENTAAFKADKIETHFAGLKKDIEIIQNSYLVKQNLPVLIRLTGEPGDPEYRAAKNSLDEGMVPKMSSMLSLFDIMLADTQGRVVYVSNPDRDFKDSFGLLSDGQKKAFQEGKDKIYFSDIFLRSGTSSKPAMMATAPAFDLDGVRIGVIAFEVDMAPIYKLIQDVTGLGKTGEVLIGKKTGDQAVILNPLRHDPQAALKKRFTIGETAGVGMQRAVQGQKGSGQYDYRGKKVIGAWRYIPSLDWGVVAKIDVDEAFVDVGNLRKLVFMILGIIIVLAGIMAFSITRSVAEPIKKLSEAAQIIGSGNLDYKVATNTKDEIGQLAGVFDKMVRDLRNLGNSRDAERQRLYSVLETLPIYVILLSEDYHVPFANKFFRERFGESGGKRCYEYLFKLSGPCENCETYKVMKTDVPHNWEWTGPDGRNYNIYDFPFIDTDGSRMILEMGIDITEQKRAQSAVKQANAYNRNLIEISLDPLVTISLEGKITDVNEATVKVTGVSRDKLIGTDFFTYFTEPEKARDGYRLVFSKGTVKDYPLTIRHKDGKLTDVLYNASVYKDEAGDVLGIFAAARDVTLQKQASQYARNLIETSLDPLVTISSEGKITDVNDATIRATGLSRQELIGTDFADYFTEPEKARDGYRDVFDKGFVTDYPLTIRHKDGRLIDVLYNASIYKDTRGNVLGVFAAARDVTLQKQAEAELRRHKANLEALVKERTSELEVANIELRRSNENLEQFAYVASHDLQEPLRMMASFSELLERRYNDKLDTDANEFIGYIVDGAKRMQRLIQDLLAYSRVGRIDMPIGEIDSNSILERVVNNMMPVIEESKAVITHDELPTLVGNESNFIQLFQNLIGNAIKFHGPELPRVHVSTVKEGGEWVFSVRDNGIGIEPQYNDRIFLIFQRLHGRDQYTGTGIGLSICKKIVETQGGRIWVESEHGKGSTFYFTIPAKGELKNE